VSVTWIAHASYGDRDSENHTRALPPWLENTRDLMGYVDGDSGIENRAKHHEDNHESEARVPEGQGLGIRTVPIDARVVLFGTCDLIGKDVDACRSSERAPASLRLASTSPEPQPISRTRLPDEAQQIIFS